MFGVAAYKTENDTTRSTAENADNFCIVTFDLAAIRRKQERNLLLSLSQRATAVYLERFHLSILVATLFHSPVFRVERRAARSYCRRMKRISFLLVAVLLCSAPVVRAQDAATEERLNKLSGHIDDLLAMKVEQDKRIAALVKEVDALREQASKPSGNYASAEDVRTLREKLKEIDEKRVADNERIVKEIEKLGKVSAPKPPKGNKTVVPPKDEPGKAGGAGGEKGFKHTIASGDTISTIAQAFRDKGVKITSEQILKANPGLKPDKLRVGQEIFIPAPQP